MSASGWRDYRLVRLLDHAWSGEAGVVADRGIVALFVLTRVAVLGQVVVTSLGVHGASGLAAGYWLVLVLTVSASLIVLGMSIRRGRLAARPWGLFDAGSVLLAYVGAVVFAGRGLHVDTVVAVYNGLAINAASAAGAWGRRPRHGIVSAAGIAGCFLTIALVSGGSSLRDAISTAIVQVAFGSATAIFSWFWRTLGDNADAMYHREMEAIRRAERAEFRNRAHSTLGLLSVILAEDEPIAADRFKTFQQAVLKEVSKLRSVVDDGPANASVGGTSRERQLEAVIWEVVEQFPDLPITVSAELAVGTELHREAVPAVRGALEAALGNVRVHAEATNVVVHAEALAGAHWEVIVSDDGIGFDPVTAPSRYGLGRQLEDLRDHDISHEVVSSPGMGCQVYLRLGQELED